MFTVLVKVIWGTLNISVLMFGVVVSYPLKGTVICCKVRFFFEIIKRKNT